MNFINVQILGRVGTVKQLKNGKYQLGVVFSSEGKDFWINIVTSKQVLKGEYIFAQGELVVSEFNDKLSLTVFTDDIVRLNKTSGGGASNETEKQ